MTTNPRPNLTQQRALAYAPKPFAALSFLSALYVMYYLLIRHPEKRDRMYHRLILSTFVCILPLSFCLFWGTWAMPEGSVPWAVGASGTSTTCSIQGFLLTTLMLAFPFYYASLSVFANVATKNNFTEEKYAWMEKWIHLGAYLLPVSTAIAAAVKDWLKPGLSHCAPIDMSGNGDASKDFHAKQISILPIVFTVIIAAELLVGTCAILDLLWRFDATQKKVDAAIGMKQIVEKARKRRHLDVALQTGLYLVSFWFGYIPTIAEALLRHLSGKLNYELIVASDCIFASQGVVIMVIYFLLQRRSERARRETLINVGQGAIDTSDHETVSKIRANAAQPKRASRQMSRFSFHIFDGTPSEDSPWMQYFESGSEESLFETVVEDIDASVAPDNSDLVTSLLEAD